MKHYFLLYFYQKRHQKHKHTIIQTFITFLLLLGHQHYDCVWTFTDIGPYSKDSIEITFMQVSQLLSTNFWSFVEFESF